MLRSEEKEKESGKQIADLQRIRLLDNRMRKQNRQSLNNEESLRSIKSTDSKKMYPMKNKIIIGEEKSQQLREQCYSNLKLNMEDSFVRNNRKITEYFPLTLSAKTPQVKNSQKREKLKKVVIQENSINDQYSQSNKYPDSSDPLKDQNKALKEKVRLKEQNFLQFKSQIKKQMLDYSVNIHKLKKNQVRQKVNHNKVRLGQFYSQRKANDFWVDGIQIREAKEKLQAITKARQELQKNKKYQSKKSNKQYIQDQEQWKNSMASQLHYYSRQQSHLQEELKKLQEEKAIHIKEYKLLYDQEHSKYGKIDQITGVCNWPKIDRYQLLGLLGKGGFSEVYKAFDTQELRQVAIKMHELSPRWDQTVKSNFVKHAKREEQVHVMLNHPNIVKHFGTFQIDESTFFQILEYCEGPDLSFYLKKHKRLPEKQAKVIIRNVLSAIKYLHQLPQKVIHYDLKPQNILFHQGKIKITDFGLCKTTNQQMIQLTSQFVGTYWYLPPQCFVTEQKPYISTKVDIWAIGVIYFEMLYGQKPFGNQMTQARIKNQGIMLKANQVNFPSTPKCTVSNESKQFIKACLKAQYEERMDIRQALAHTLFEKK